MSKNKSKFIEKHEEALWDIINGIQNQQVSGILAHKQFTENFE
jgi:hypothetical protein